MDPTEGVDVRMPHTIYRTDIFVTKLTPVGSFEWTFTTGGLGDDGAGGVVTDASGYIYVAGGFQQIVDLDPGPGVDLHAAPERSYLGNTFLAKLGPDGTYLWGRSFQMPYGEATALLSSIGIDVQGNLVLAGVFGGDVDFDPGPGEARRASQNTGLYVVKLSSDGGFIWVQTFGGRSASGPKDVLLDAAGNVFVSGIFRGTVDFDPGPGIDRRTVERIRDNVFVMKLHPDGSYAGTVTYPIWDAAMAVTPEGDLVVTGGFTGTVDFDPTSKSFFQTAVPGYDPFGYPKDDLFVTKLDSAHGHVWTYTAGSPAVERGMAVVVDPSGDVVVSGNIVDTTVDFDPGPQLAEYTCDAEGGGTCHVLLRLRSDGTFVSVQGTHLAAETFYRRMIADSAGNILIERSILDGVDVDPGCEVVTPGLGGYVTKLTCAPRDGDFDEDGDIDLFDLGRYQSCFEGEGSETCAAGCDVFDLTPDNALDLSDLPAFQALLTGPR